MKKATFDAFAKALDGRDVAARGAAFKIHIKPGRTLDAETAEHFEELAASIIAAGHASYSTAHAAPGAVSFIDSTGCEIVQAHKKGMVYMISETAAIVGRPHDRAGTLYDYAVIELDARPAPIIRPPSDLATIPEKAAPVTIDAAAETPAGLKKAVNGMTGIQTPYNPFTRAIYSGKNIARLMQKRDALHTDDFRFMTFPEIAGCGYRLRKGAKAVYIFRLIDNDGGEFDDPDDDKNETNARPARVKKIALFSMADVVDFPAAGEIVYAAMPEKTAAPKKAAPPKRSARRKGIAVTVKGKPAPKKAPAAKKASGAASGKKRAAFVVTVRKAPAAAVAKAPGMTSDSLF